tara:strand:+ start:3225 stop:3749 length:525 start_codon:yes stop_codon:yes gene_type:complete
MRAALLFLSSFVFSSDLPELLSKNHIFSADIIISDSESIVSKGYMSYLDGDFIYSVEYPSNQILAGLEGFLYIQDDDFKQVMIYRDDEAFLVKQLLLNSYEYDELSCSSKCYKLNINDGRISNAIIIFKNNLLYEMHVLNFQNNKFLIKFENFVLESTNISYIAPEGYEIITDD